jgi:hypothetical protein
MNLAGKRLGRCGAAGPHNDAFRHLLLLLLCHFLLGHPTLKTPIAVLAAIVPGQAQSKTA